MYFEIYAALLASAIILSKSLEANHSVTNEEISEINRENIFNGSGIVTELQHSICSIKTDEIVAKAQSTASRILTGICTSEDVTKAFARMEKALLRRLDEVQQNLTMLMQSKLMQSSVPSKKNHGYAKVSAFRTIKELLDKKLLDSI